MDLAEYGLRPVGAVPVARVGPADQPAPLPVPPTNGAAAQPGQGSAEPGAGQAVRGPRPHRHCHRGQTLQAGNTAQAQIYFITVGSEMSAILFSSHAAPFFYISSFLILIFKIFYHSHLSPFVLLFIALSSLLILIFILFYFLFLISLSSFCLFLFLLIFLIFLIHSHSSTPDLTSIKY
jgi:hypothetical protein